MMFGIKRCVLYTTLIYCNLIGVFDTDVLITTLMVDTDKQIISRR